MSEDLFTHKHRPLPLRGYSGRIGGMVFYESNGKQYVRRLPERHGPLNRSYLRMVRWCAWGNTINLWKAMPAEARGLFEHLKPGRTAYNEFVASAQTTQRVFLTKRLVADCACVVTEVPVSRGSLAEIRVTPSADRCVTDICLGSLVATASTTVAEFSRAVVRNNRGYADGDILLFLLAAQLVDYASGRPYVVMRCCRVPLSLIDETPLAYLVSGSIGFDCSQGYLGSSQRPMGGMAWVHVRHGYRGCLMVSSQRLVVNNADLLAQYGGYEAFLVSADSYGGITAPGALQPGLTEQELSRLNIFPPTTDK